MTRVMVLAAALSVLLIGCGNAGHTYAPGTGSTDGAKPPQASVTIGTEQIPMVINGYQWTEGNQSSIADAASDPVKNLTEYPARAGQQVMLAFRQRPQSMELSMWSSGIKESTSVLKSLEFSLPSQVGDYTYEITCHWGNEYVNYDFAVQVH